jgi:carbon storage regulator
MLVLSRKLNESIVIGDKITVTVLKVDRNCVRLGIEAPADVPIFRQELLDARQGADPVAPLTGSAPHAYD